MSQRLRALTLRHSRLFPAPSKLGEQDSVRLEKAPPASAARPVDTHSARREECGGDRQSFKDPDPHSQILQICTGTSKSNSLRARRRLGPMQGHALRTLGPVFPDVGRPGQTTPEHDTASNIITAATDKEQGHGTAWGGGERLIETCLEGGFREGLRSVC